MSELKWNWAYSPYLDPPEKQKESALKAGYIKVVDKAEADKVITDLEESHREEVGQLLMEIAKLKSDIADLRDDKRLTDSILDERNYAESQLCADEKCNKDKEFMGG